MKQIEFNHSAADGVHSSIGELIERNGYQYALHYYQCSYDAIELSTGFSVASVSVHTEKVNGVNVRNYLIQQIEKKIITTDVIERTKEVMLARGIEFPVNPKFESEVIERPRPIVDDSYTAGF